MSIRWKLMGFLASLAATVWTGTLAADVFEQTYGPKPVKPKPVVIDTRPRSKRSES